ncbi:hypothetical protein [Altererythrobacter sp. ZODW24]|uniref:hypothetical protein n=1 Tax=Altererythrobacter sp. ZODW24 TaxID=2185142 RepID=UPI0013B3DC68|nr:hypothetical protein [Altererythrobacter sp. ZODW24]
MKNRTLRLLAITLALPNLVSCSTDEMPQTKQDAYLGCYFYDGEIALLIRSDGVLNGDQSLLSREFNVVPHKRDIYLEIEREIVLDRKSGLVRKGREFAGFSYKFVGDGSGDLGIEIGDSSGDFGVLPRLPCVND